MKNVSPQHHNQGLMPVSTTLEAPLSRQKKTTHSGALQKLTDAPLFQWAETAQDRELAIAFTSSRPLKNSPDMEAAFEQVVNVLGMWCAQLSLFTVPSGQELNIISQFIFLQYGFLTIEELSLAIKLSITQAFDVDIRVPHGRFSVQYVQTILSAYQIYRNENLKRLDERRTHDLLQAEVQKVPSPAEQCEMMRQMVATEYARFKVHQKVIDFGSAIWKYLKATGKIKVTEAEKQQALAYAERKVKDLKENPQPGEKRVGQMFEELFHFRGEREAINYYAREMCLKKWFETLHLAEFLTTIQPQDFKTVTT